MTEESIPTFDDYASAVCSRAQAETLVCYDHHRGQAAGRWGILITSHWLPLDEARAPLIALVVFNPSRQHLPSEDQARAMVFKHPLAPPDGQAIIAELQFQPVGPT